jgi:chlorophyll(ide) b reductase
MLRLVSVLSRACCCLQAINRMKSQPAGGHVFNMDGAGADGNATPRFAAYGATKRSLQQVKIAAGAPLGANLADNMCQQQLCHW